MNATATIEKKIAPAPIISEETPAWMVKIVKRQIAFNKRYEKARSQFATVWNTFLESVDEINFINGTNFTPEQAFDEFEGQISDEDDDDDEDDE